MKKAGICLLLIVVFGVVGLLVREPKADAGYCSPGGFGVPGCHGYFSGAGSTCVFTICHGPGNVLSKGLYANNASDMINIIYGNLFSGDTHNQRGAAFVVDAMLGHNTFENSGSFGAGVAYAQNNFGQWQNIVNSYANSNNPASYGISWSVLGGDNRNSEYFPDIQDDGFHTAQAFIDDQGNYIPINAPVIEFYWSGGAHTFKIERDCANLAGELATPPVNSPPSGSLSVTCDLATGQETATISFGDPDGPTWGRLTAGSWDTGYVYPSPGSSIPIPRSAYSPYTAQSVSLWVWDSGPAGSGPAGAPVDTKLTVAPCVTFTCGNMTVDPGKLDPYMHFNAMVAVNNNVGITPSAPAATMSLSITPPSGASYSFSGSQPAGGSGSTSTGTFNNLGPTNQTGQYGVSWTLSGPGFSKTCNDTLSVVYLPYLSIYGGDVMTGTSASYNGGASSCNSATAAAGIFGWNDHTTTFAGAGAQYAVQTLGQIEDFASAQNSSSQAPTGLSFANVYTPPDVAKLNPGAGLFGGNFASTGADCDFTSDLTVAPTTTDTTIDTTGVPLGTRDVRYVKGADVFIKGSGITYANPGGWTNASQVPFFKLVVVGGNIYIDPGVRQLDGVYVAEPSGGTGGKIFTCATAIRVPVNPATVEPPAPGYYATCNNQLVVNGAFVAQQVQFLRTAGSLGQAVITDGAGSSHAAEVFNYTPELWLPRGTNPNSGYSATTSLPPVL